MKNQESLQRIQKMLQDWESEVKYSNYNNFNDINTISEGFVEVLLNAVYDYNLVDLNKIQKNHPYIDLGDKKNKIAFQVTAKKRNYAAKIKETLNGFYSDSKLSKEYSGGVKFFFIKDKIVTKSDYSMYKSFDCQKDIYSVGSVLNTIAGIAKNNPNKLYEIEKAIKPFFTNPNGDTDINLDNPGEFVKKCFSRNAFIIPAREYSWEDFEKALNDTRMALNTGVLYTSDGRLISKSKLNIEFLNEISEIKLNKINKKLFDLYDTFQKYKKMIKKCHNGKFTDMDSIDKIENNIVKMKIDIINLVNEFIVDYEVKPIEQLPNIY